MSRQPAPVGVATPRPEGSAAERIAGWSRALTLNDVPGEVLERVKLHVLDQLGCQLACSELPAALAARRYAERFGAPGRATVFGPGVRAGLDPEAAGFANATAGHSYEIDDYGYGAFAHPGCVVVPGALAVGETTGATGAATLLAVTAGFEHVLRLARAGMPSMLLDRGFHETAAHGSFSVALAASMLLDAPAPVIAHALAIAGSHASGTTEFSRSGGDVKRVHAGIGVAAGIRSARLAQLGLTGPRAVLEGRRGFLQAFSAEYDASYLTDGLGSTWYFAEHGALKLAAACGLLHQHFAAVDSLVRDGAIDLHDRSGIESVVLGCDPLTAVHCGGVGPYPRDEVGAQFSAEYSIAMRLAGRGNSRAAYRAAAAVDFRDEPVTKLAEKVRVVEDPECVAAFPREWLGRVTIRMTDGREVSTVGRPLGSPANPVGRDEVVAKYLDLVGPVLEPGSARRSVDLILRLEELPALTDLVGALVDRTPP